MDRRTGRGIVYNPYTFDGGGITTEIIQLSFVYMSCVLDLHVLTS